MKAKTWALACGLVLSTGSQAGDIALSSSYTDAMSELLNRVQDTQDLIQEQIQTAADAAESASASAASVQNNLNKMIACLRNTPSSRRVVTSSNSNGLSSYSYYQSYYWTGSSCATHKVTLK